MDTLRDDPYEVGCRIKDGLKLTCICRRETNMDCIAIINLGADQSMNQSCDSLQSKWLADETELVHVL